MSNGSLLTQNSILDWKPQWDHPYIKEIQNNPRASAAIAGVALAILGVAGAFLALHYTVGIKASFTFVGKEFAAKTALGKWAMPLGDFIAAGGGSVLLGAAGVVGAAAYAQHNKSDNDSPPVRFYLEDGRVIEIQPSKN